MCPPGLGALSSSTALRPSRIKTYRQDTWKGNTPNFTQIFSATREYGDYGPERSVATDCEAARLLSMIP